jgi:hypothetical protein
MAGRFWNANIVTVMSRTAAIQLRKWRYYFEGRLLLPTG